MIVLSIIRGGGERISRKPITSPLRLSFPPSPSIFFLLSPPPPSGYLAPLRVYHCLAPPAPTRFLPPGNSRDTTLETSRRLASCAPVRWNSLSRRRNEFVRGDDERGDGNSVWRRFARSKGTVQVVEDISPRHDVDACRTRGWSVVESGEGGRVSWPRELGECFESWRKHRARFYIPIRRKYVIRSINDVQGGGGGGGERHGWRQVR